MTPGTILYVDDEALALKYFERLVAPLAPVLTASTVAQGRALLDEHAGKIAVLVSDQRMPGAPGNELLRHARERHPNVVRMLTTAYSELGEAIEAINSGEIYRYIAKPWDMESLQADLRNALELAVLRFERDGLLREKLLMQQQQLLGQRAGQLLVACGADPNAPRAVHAFLQTAMRVGCAAPAIDWRVLDHAALIQLEAARAVAVARLLAAEGAKSLGAATAAGEALAALAKSLPGKARLRADAVNIGDASVFTGLLAALPQEGPGPHHVAWLAWLLRRGAAGVRVAASASGWDVTIAPEHESALPADWLAADVEQLQSTVGA